MKRLVFVYGSLKRGFWNNQVLGESNKLGDATTVDSFLMTTVGFPYMIPTDMVRSYLRDKIKPVRGEVYEVVDEHVMRRLDNLEGVSYGHYEHKEIDVMLDGEVVRVTAYTPCNEDTQEYPIVESEEYYEWL